MRVLVCKRLHLVLVRSEGELPVAYYQPCSMSPYALAAAEPVDGDKCPVEIDRWQRTVRSDVPPDARAWRTRVTFKGPCTARLTEVPAVGAALLFCGPARAHEEAQAWRKETKRRRSSR